MRANQALRIDKESCVKCGGCISAYPNIFEFDQNGDVRIKNEAVVEVEKVPEIKSMCPVGAIIEN